MLQLPVPFDSTGNPLPAFSQFLKLDGTLYSISIRWSARATTWLLDLGDNFGNILAFGFAIRANQPIIPPTYLNVFPGIIIPVDTTGLATDPGRNDLGNRVVLQYLEAADRALIPGA